MQIDEAKKSKQTGIENLKQMEERKNKKIKKKKKKKHLIINGGESGIRTNNTIARIHTLEKLGLERCDKTYLRIVVLQ